MIYTSYFANIDNLPKDAALVSICGKAPDWYGGTQFKCLAPKWDFFQEWKKNHDNDFYIRNYKLRVLDNLDPADIVRQLENIGKGQDIVLLCYERPTDFCHRHLVSAWLRRNGYECKEYPN